jgi:hypothetical protein
MSCACRTEISLRALSRGPIGLPGGRVDSSAERAPPVEGAFARARTWRDAVICVEAKLWGWAEGSSGAPLAVFTSLSVEGIGSLVDCVGEDARSLVMSFLWPATESMRRALDITKQRATCLLRWAPTTDAASLVLPGALSVEATCKDDDGHGRDAPLRYWVSGEIEGPRRPGLPGVHVHAASPLLYATAYLQAVSYR